MSWRQGPESNTARQKFSCIVSTNNVLYAIGGYGNNGATSHLLKTIECISISNIDQNTWDVIGNNLPSPLSGSEAVI